MPLSLPILRIFLSRSSSVNTTQHFRHVGRPSRRRMVGLPQRTQGSLGSSRFTAPISSGGSVFRKDVSLRARFIHIHSEDGSMSMAKSPISLNFIPVFKGFRIKRVTRPASLYWT